MIQIQYRFPSSSTYRKPAALHLPNYHYGVDWIDDKLLDINKPLLVTLNPLQQHLQEAPEGNLLGDITSSNDSDFSFDEFTSIDSSPSISTSSNSSSCGECSTCGDADDEQSRADTTSARHQDSDLSDAASQSDDEDSDGELSDGDDTRWSMQTPPEALRQCTIQETIRPTMYEEFTKSGLDWCRYCGVTKGGQTTASFRPGPWGKRTLCNCGVGFTSKHGCDYKGYGYADKQSRLDLSRFTRESAKDRIRPILQDFCATCFQKDVPHASSLIQCNGCPRAFHPTCYSGAIRNSDDGRWYCDPQCESNRRLARVVLDLPKRRLPFMTAGISERGLAQSEGLPSEWRASDSSKSTPSKRRHSSGHGSAKDALPKKRRDSGCLDVKGAQERNHPY
ncbi:uncharacterized protein EV422DRAFT_609239 [Fimicolochytrium jonesii]|uniref:uncharacterized protein n=1 Tax=Fimicolochytrium jonesii TaxID=1396493 RepID=UPI0022FDE0B1|nr:uncharacterized protein EV422DRAFT_609239 [Fimicolochytrium jonesii]KAI8824191.1 hypothetical protein EV422DRAFT_609239 [Fimicolochytrium jonesii]